jgi:RNA polymerase sigma-70 factor (ECF subfamily)
MSGRLIPLRRVDGEIVDLSDEALLAACGTGDAAALGALFDRFHRDVYRLAGRFPSIDALGRDDLVQATFLEVRRTARSFRGASSVRTWILGVAANLARRTLRGEQRRSAREETYAGLPVAAVRAVDEEVADRRLLAQVQAAMAELPRDQLMVFVLCDLEQLAAAEVAAVVGAPEGTVWRRLHHARRAIRAAIERSAR